MIETIRQGLKEDGFTVSITKLCQWFDIPRRTVYYKPTTRVRQLKFQPVDSARYFLQTLHYRLT